MVRGLAGTTWRAVLQLGAVSSLVLGASACSTFQGYPNDPDNSAAVIATLTPFFDASTEVEYKNADPGSRRGIRNTIVINRMRLYDIEFDRFEKELWASGNAVTTGGDLVAIALGAIAATTGNATTKAALAAASTGVVGAQAAINRDLYFQRTLPALIAQMEANRAKIETTILTGLGKSDDEYSLYQAELDLQHLKRAGSIPSAVSVITQQSSADNQAAQEELQAVRLGKFSTSSSSERIRAWLYPNGKAKDANGKPVKPDPVKVARLQNWMLQDTTDRTLQQLPYDVLIDVDNAAMEADRQRAIKALNIP